jgi:hypothetical protein
MYLILSALLAVTTPSEPQNPKKPLRSIESEEETVYLDTPDDLPSQEVVIDDSLDDFFSDLDEENE